jgi:CRISPR-associated protein Cas2
MMVMTLQNVPPALRGQMTRYLIETANGVYIGQVSARIRDKLWELCEKGLKEGVVFQAWSTNNEQGFAMRMSGGERCVIDWEGINVVLEPGRELTKTEQKRMGKG